MRSSLNALTTAACRSARRLTVASAVALPALLAAVPAQAKPTFALTCIGTETESAINFQYRWGTTSEWRSTSVSAGKWQMLSYNYSYPGENSSPQLHIRFDDDMSSGISYKVVRVSSYAASEKHCESQGWKLNFYQRGDRLRLVDEEDNEARL